EPLAHVAGQRTNVRALAATYLDVQVRILVGKDVNSADVDGPRAQCDVFAASGKLVCPTASNLRGRESRRRLFDDSYERRQTRLQGCPIRRRRVRRGCDRSVHVIGIAAVAEENA